MFTALFTLEVVCFSQKSPLNSEGYNLMLITRAVPYKQWSIRQHVIGEMIGQLVVYEGDKALSTYNYHYSEINECKVVGAVGSLLTISISMFQVLLGSLNLGDFSVHVTSFIDISNEGGKPRIEARAKSVCVSAQKGRQQSSRRQCLYPRWFTRHFDSPFDGHMIDKTVRSF